MKQTLRRTLTVLVLCAALAGPLAAPASAAFSDVPSGHWAAESIRRCVEQGYFNGQSASRFGLGQSMSRGAFAAVLCRFFGWETAAPTAPTYSDVPVDAWYAGAVETAYRHGAFTDQRSVFRPNDPITREELAVTLLRAMGYGTLAGLAQDLPSPFTDVTTNAGYIALAHDMGLMGGVSDTAFSPAGTATREQVAAILMRLHDQLYARTPEITGVAASADADLTELDIAAIPAARIFSTDLKALMEPEEAAALQAAARAAGAKAYLYLEGGVGILGRNQALLPARIAEAAAGYDGLILHITGVSAQDRRSLTTLVRAVDAALGDLPFQLVAEAPSRTGSAGEGYAYETLAQLTDRLILKLPAVEDRDETFTVAPVDPLEAVHYALAAVGEQVGAEKLGLMLDSELTCWTAGKQSALTGEELSALLADRYTRVYDSDRYACAYLTGRDKDRRPLTVWYLTAEDVAARVHLAVSLGAGRICVSDWDAATEDFRAGLR